MNEAFKTRRTRIGALTLGMAALFVLAATKLTMLVLIDGPRLSSLAHDEHTTHVELAAVRGPIVDRNGRSLALSAETRSIYARPQKLVHNSTPQKRAELARMLGMTPQELESRLDQPSPFVWLERHMEIAKATKVMALGLEGVGDVSEYKRFYPEGNLAASVVGLAGMDGQGLSGVELQYNKLIRGKPVELSLYHDAFGHLILDSPADLKSAQPGAKIVLTIDASIQGTAQQDLAREVRESGATHGSAVVLDPFTGEVLALANVSAHLSKLGERLQDPAVQDAFEPGSTMKGVLGSIALEDHVVTPSEEIYCQEGEWRVGGCVIHDDSPHGWLQLGRILEVSSNIGAAKIALAIGPERFYNGLMDFGFGHRTGIDLPGEAPGIVRKPSAWDKIDTANHGFGQGIAVTPIQLAVAYGAIANGGVLMRPYVVKAAYAADGREIFEHTPQVLRRVISPDVAHTMNMLLRNVVNGRDGTGRLAHVADFTVAGKTGTAQMVDPKTGAYYQHHLVSSFIGFVPANNPRLVILVVLYDVSHGHFGGLVAAPVFSEIASTALEHLDVMPSNTSYETASLLPVGLFDSDANAREEGASDVDQASTASARRMAAMAEIAHGRTPDFRGMSLRNALAYAREAGVFVNVKGSGYVAQQDPLPGAPLGHSPVRLSLTYETDLKLAESQARARQIQRAWHR